MTGSTRLTNLRNVLAELYPDEASIRRLMADAGINATRITLTSSAANNWHAILTEAEKLGRIDALLAVALTEYGENARLQVAVVAYRNPEQLDNQNTEPPALTPPPLATPANQPIDIFLSYSRNDSAALQRLRGDLQAAGFTVWIDDLDLEAGTPSWRRAIEAAIQTARCLVVMLSPAAKASEWVEKELIYAEHLQRRIFPVLVSGDPISAVPISLFNQQWVDLRTGWGRVQSQLIPALQRHLRAGVVQPLPPSRLPQTARPQPDYRWRWGLGLAALLLLVGVGVTAALRPGSIFNFAAAATHTPAAAALATQPPPTATVASTLTPTATATPSPDGAATAVARQTAEAATRAVAAPTATDTTTATATPEPTDTPTPLPTETPTATATPTLGIGSTFTNPRDGAVYVYVPVGPFLMGSTEAQIDDAFKICLEFYKECKREPFTNETPQRTVTLDAFWIMQTEVSNAQYQKCVEAKACPAPNNDTWDKAENADYPVTHVDWQQASDYATWAGGQLPSEAQWEKAARGPDGLIYPWDNEWNGAWVNFCDKNCTFDHKDSAANDGYAQTAPVNSYPEGASPYGARNMAGNVWEWVQDWYAADYYATAPDQNPPGPTTGEFRSLRGGSWDFQRDLVRAGFRFRYAPAAQNDNLGFRVVRLSSPGF